MISNYKQVWSGNLILYKIFLKEAVSERNGAYSVVSFVACYPLHTPLRVSSK